MSDDLEAAGLTAKERLGRIEELLDKMDRKLDDKASMSEVIALEARVRELELHGSESVRKMEPAVNKLFELVRQTEKKMAYYAGAAAVAVVLATALLDKAMH